MRISVITPTCNRPVAFRLCERWMARQTRQPDEWIVGDGGTTPQTLTMGQTHLHAPSAPGYLNLIGNLRRAVEVATGDILVIMENDDWYHPTHLEVLLGQSTPGILAAGDDHQRYYNVAQRVWRLFPNKGASLCQTGFTRAALPFFRKALDRAAAERSFGVDGRFWASLPDTTKRLQRTETVLGIKGLPGQVGLGVGHRPSGPGWQPDPHLTHLRTWIGQDVEVYAALRKAA